MNTHCRTCAAFRGRPFARARLSEFGRSGDARPGLASMLVLVGLSAGAVLDTGREAGLVSRPAMEVVPQGKAPGFDGPLILVRGEQRTGLSFLNKILEANFHGDSIAGGVVAPSNSRSSLVCPVERGRRALDDTAFACWEHGYANASEIHRIAKCDGGQCDRSKLLLVTVTSNPYMWLVRMWQRAETCVGCVQACPGL